MVNFVTSLPIFVVLQLMFFLVAIFLTKIKIDWLIFKLTKRIKILIVISGITIILYLLMCLLIASIRYRVIQWYLVYALLISILSLTIVSAYYTGSSKYSALLFTLTLIVFSSLNTLSLLILGSIPIASDEGRFIGFSYRIVKDSKWYSFKYPENNYYQLFHIVPFIRALISTITNLSLVRHVHILMVFTLNLALILTVYQLIKSLFNKRFYGLFGILLLFIAPAISIIGFLPRSLSEVLTIITLMVIFSSLRKGELRYEVIPLYIAGVLVHPTFILLIASFILVAYTVQHLSAHSMKKRSVAKQILKRHLMLLTMITICYWTTTAALAAVVVPGKNFILSLVNVLISFMQNFPSTSAEEELAKGMPLFHMEFSYAIRKPWYVNAPIYWAISWSFLPALTLASILLYAFIRRSNFKKHLNFIVIAQGLTALLLIFGGYVGRFIGGLYVHIGYYSYLLMLVPGIAYVRDVMNSRSISIIIFLTMLILALNISVLDYAYTPDHSRLLPTPTYEDWLFGQNIATFVTTDYTKYVLKEVRLSLNARLLKDSPQLFEFYNYRIRSTMFLVIDRSYENTGALVFTNGKYYVKLMGALS